MAEKSSFFTSLNGDRKYKSSDFAEYFGTFISNGVFPNPNTNLQVTANEDMTITIAPGYAWINGYMYSNTEDLKLRLEYADGSLNRIDRVVIRLDMINREIKIHVKKGEFSNSPAAKELQRDQDIYELGIADINITAGVLVIEQNNISDTRLNSDLCGMVNSLIKVDPTILTDKLESDFYEWLNSIQNILGDDATGNIILRIQQLEEAIKNMELVASKILMDDGNTVEDTINNIKNIVGIQVDRGFNIYNDIKAKIGDTIG